MELYRIRCHHIWHDIEPGEGRRITLCISILCRCGEWVGFHWTGSSIVAEGQSLRRPIPVFEKDACEQCGERLQPPEQTVLWWLAFERAQEDEGWDTDLRDIYREEISRWVPGGSSPSGKKNKSKPNKATQEEARQRKYGGYIAGEY